MRSNKKYKGKYTKKRLYNKVRGSLPFGMKPNPCVPIVQDTLKLESYIWYTEGKITFDQFQQWGY